MSISEQTKLIASNFIHQLNAQDHQAIAKTLNYPHIRLAKGEFQTIANQEEFAVLSEQGENWLRNESWDHTVVECMESILWTKTRFT